MRYFPRSSSLRQLLIITAGLLASIPAHLSEAKESTLASVNAYPRIALVIGNSKYLQAPLKNPANDARTIAAQLINMGFQVTIRLDASKQEMADAMRTFSNDLAKDKVVGLFYFAGHGVQLNWRNYLVPVDAKINKLEDIQNQAVDVGSLLDNLKQARNPMNVIILDACRNNPFGSNTKTEQKGLSQMDAPPGTLLAYATSPGNVAQDGEGNNGLYTEYLLKEMRVPETKIEDIFKRTRLGVRLDSTGQQIPWESTSLEQDFYFIPPKQIKKLSPEELDRQFEEELAIWQQIKAVKVPGPLEDYLKKYPSGKFAELAQFRLDRILARAGEKPVLVASLAPTPFSQGTARSDGDFKIGDNYTYRTLDLISKAESARKTETVTAITDTEVIYNDGAVVTNLLGDYLMGPNGFQYSTALQMLVSEYAVGKTWSSRTTFTNPQIARRTVKLDFKVIGKEKITVPAGTFDTYKIKMEGWSDSGSKWDCVIWVAPDRVRRFVAFDFVVVNQWGRYSFADRFELVSFKQGS